MTIEIIKEPPIYLTAAEADRLHREWDATCRYTVNPPTFEAFVRSRKEYRELVDGLPATVGESRE